MFGTLPGEEQFLGKMNQFVVSKLVTTNRVYWVLHTKATNPTSVLMTDLKRLAMKDDDVTRQVSLITLQEEISATVWEEVANNHVLKWGSETQKTQLRDEVKRTPIRSRVIGHEVVDAA